MALIVGNIIGVGIFNLRGSPSATGWVRQRLVNTT
jgi:hypothetical protein